MHSFLFGRAIKHKLVGLRNFSMNMRAHAYNRTLQCRCRQWSFMTVYELNGWMNEWMSAHHPYWHLTYTAPIQCYMYTAVYIGLYCRLTLTYKHALKKSLSFILLLSMQWCTMHECMAEIDGIALKRWPRASETLTNMSFARYKFVIFTYLLIQEVGLCM